MSTLYLVSTPIGNLADITIRALEVLFSVDLILCEDTRETKKLLQHYRKEGKGQTVPKLLSYNDHHRDRRIPRVLERLVKGDDVALVTDRGTPLLSDPGYKLVQQVIKLAETNPSVQIEPIPGANALLPALQLSGLPQDKFCFVGFLPPKVKRRQKVLTGLPRMTVVAYESPRRVLDTLRDLYDVYGDIDCAVIAELTKVHQRVYRGKVTEVLEGFHQHPNQLKGEFTLVFNPRKEC